MDYLTEHEVRTALLDLEVRENQLDLDLQFSAEEIAEATKRMCRRYNSTAPYVDTLEPARVPLTFQFAVDGVIAELLVAEVSKLARNEISYSTGDVSVNLVGDRRKAMLDLYGLYRANFEKGMMDRKRTINTASLYAIFG